MTELLARAFDTASQLPELDQDELARQLLAELADEARWDATLQRTQDQLERLADRALEQFRAGRTSPALKAGQPQLPPSTTSPVA